MERAWPYDLDCCKFCEKTPDEVDYKSRGLCGTCFKRVQYKGNLRDYCRYPEDRMRLTVGARRLVICQNLYTASGMLGWERLRIASALVMRT